MRGPAAARGCCDQWRVRRSQDEPGPTRHGSLWLPHASLECRHSNAPGDDRVNIRARSGWIVAALAASLGCSPSDDGKPGTTGTTLKQAGKDAVQTAKDVGGQVADGLSSAADSLEDFIESA